MVSSHSHSISWYTPFLCQFESHFEIACLYINSRNYGLLKPSFVGPDIRKEMAKEILLHAQLSEENDIDKKEQSKTELCLQLEDDQELDQNIIH